MNVPNDVILEIIKHLPMLTLLQFYQCNKNIYKLCSNNKMFRYFIKHLNKISCGEYFSLIVSDNKLYGFGYNAEQQICDSSKNYIYEPLLLYDNIISITSGHVNSLILTPNTYHILGHSKMVIDIDINTYISSHFGKDHVLIYTTKGLWVCGNNLFGQLGIGYTDDLYVKDPLLLPFTFNNIVDIGVGNYHNIILTVYEAYGFGCNNCNQLGLTEELNYDTPQQLDLYGPFVACAAGASHSVIITTTDIYGCGNNLYGQLGVGNTKHCDKFTKIDIKDAISVKCGEFYTMVLTKHNTLYSFGDNYYGTLGFKIDYATIPQQIFTKYNVVNFSCGYNHAIVCTKGKRKNSKFKYHVMGSNKYAQLGLGRYKKAIIKIPKLLTL